MMLSLITFTDSDANSFLLAFLPYIALFLTIFGIGVYTLVTILRNHRHFTHHNFLPVLFLSLGLLCLLLLYLERRGPGSSGGFLGNEWFYLQAGLTLIVISWLLTHKHYQDVGKKASNKLRKLPVGFTIKALVIILCLFYVSGVIFTQLQEDNRNQDLRDAEDKAIVFAAAIENSELSQSKIARIQLSDDCMFGRREVCSFLLAHDKRLSSITLSSFRDAGVDCKYRPNSTDLGELQIDCFVKTELSGFYIDRLYTTSFGKKDLQRQP